MTKHLDFFLGLFFIAWAIGYVFTGKVWEHVAWLGSSL